MAPEAHRTEKGARPQMSSDPKDRKPTMFQQLHPFRFRLAKGVLSLFDRQADLEVDGLWSMACRLAKCKGATLPADIRDPLSVLVESLQTDARLNTLGRRGAYNMLLLQLTTRLQVDQALRANPVIGGTQLPATLVVVGLPRTGTTLLHRLMAQDPDARAPQLWEMYYPVLDPVHFRRYARMRKLAAKNTITALRWWVDQLDKIHPSRHDSTEECIFLLARTFMCEQFYLLLGDVRGYLDWSRDQDYAAAYACYADQLRLLIAQDPARRLVLKAPEHLAHLDTLLDTLPEARVIWLHRDPADAVPSYCSLVGMYHHLISDDFSAPALGQHVVERMAEWIGRGRKVCEDRDDGRVLHVAYADLVRDPFAVVERAYSHWGQPLESRALESMRRWVAANPKDKHGHHRYTLEEFGLAGDQVAGLFEDYERWAQAILTG